MVKCLRRCGQDLSDTDTDRRISGHETCHNLSLYTREGIKKLYEMGLLTSHEIKDFKDKSII